MTLRVLSTIGSERQMTLTVGIQTGVYIQLTVVYVCTIDESVNTFYSTQFYPLQCIEFEST